MTWWWNWHAFQVDFFFWNQVYTILWHFKTYSIYNFHIQKRVVKSIWPSFVANNTELNVIQVLGPEMTELLVLVVRWNGPSLFWGNVKQRHVVHIFFLLLFINEPNLLTTLWHPFFWWLMITGSKYHHWVMWQPWHIKRGLLRKCLCPLSWLLHPLKHLQCLL